MTHDSHEEGYRYVQPQACIDELRAALEAIIDPFQAVEAIACASEGKPLTATGQALLNQARATLEKTKP